MRTRSKRARKCPICRLPMRKNGHDRTGRQRWQCDACRATTTATVRSRSRESVLRLFLDWLRGLPTAAAGMRRAHFPPPQRMVLGPVAAHHPRRRGASRGRGRRHLHERLVPADRDRRQRRRGARLAMVRT
ncbi:IS1/IS1595 family N-terminal zinc-binding domain-containing protein, partial [Bifidobacterium italicum]